MRTLGNIRWLAATASLTMAGPALSPLGEDGVSVDRLRPGQDVVVAP